jgi:hypothetical protein
MKKSLILILGLFWLAGCSSNLPKDLPKCYPCQIHVIQGGAPLVDAVVMLQSPEVGQQWFPMGTTDQTGTAVMFTNGRYRGAPAGVYKVLISKLTFERGNHGPAPPEDTPAYSVWLERMSNVSGTTYTLIEPQYNDAKQTPHEIEVKSKGKNAMTVDVGQAVKIKMP